uniref:Methyltransferase like 23 n=1 Tax=Cyprinus carpio TaxID=7962 RepID=A0A8C2II50_CYPCA
MQGCLGRCPAEFRSSLKSLVLVSLPGVVASKCGAHVILSDSAELPLCLRNSNLIGLTWGRVSPELLSLPPVDIILGSDVFYEPEDEYFEDVLVTVSFIMKRNCHFYHSVSILHTATLKD